MGLVGVRGSDSTVNMALLMQAFEFSSCLLLDCANCANPHALFPHVPQERFDNVHVIEIEMLYKFRDVLRLAPRMAKSLQADCVIITTFKGLFNYDNKNENRAVYRHAWELMKLLSKNRPVIVGVENGSEQDELANKYCDEIFDLVV